MARKSGLEPAHKAAYLKVISAAVILGSMGLIVRRIPLSSAEIAFVRAFLGSLFLWLVIALSRPVIDWASLKKQMPLLTACGCASALMMAFLYEAYRHTSISNATLIFYCGPLLAMLASPLVVKERLTGVKLAGITLATGGLVLINITNLGALGPNPVRGLLFGLLSATMYATLIMLNKRIKGISGLLSTAVLLLISWIVLLPYIIVTHQGPWQLPTGEPLFFILVLGVVHGGLACYLYYSSFRQLPAQSIALCGYLEPLSALFFSAAFLAERLSPLQWLGAVLIFGGAAFGELYHRKTGNSTPPRQAPEPQRKQNE